MRAHQLSGDGTILNTIEVESLDVFPNLVDATIGGNIGDKITNGAVIAKPIDTSAIKASVLAQIAQLERDSMLNRGSRELELVNMIDIATRKAEKFKVENPSDERTVVVLTAEYLAATPYYSKLVSLDSQAKALRDQYNAL